MSWTRRATPAPGDLIFSREAPMGEVGAVPRDAPVCLGQRTVLLRLDADRIDQHFLLYSLMSPESQAWIVSNSAGSTVLHINVADVRKIPIPLLPELDEQRRIVDLIEDHLSRLDAAGRYLAAATRRLSVMVSSVLLDLVPNESAYPESWRRVTVAEAGTVGLGRQRHPDWHNGPNMKPYLRVANVFEDRIDTSDVMEMHWPEDTFDRFRLHPGDVLLNEGQTPDLLGRPAIYRGAPAETAFTNSLIRFRANDDVLPEFALLVFRRHMRAGRFRRESRITTNIAHLSAARLKPVEFPIPPLEDQQRMVSVANRQLNAVKRLTDELATAKAHQANLRRSLLAAAFSGRLSVSSA
ncbi:restriction endonuclease subunit S [Aeromicrobium sp. Root495]|uniref:restriction endonuclease subunit S n=1 Tax=Aeromicrobium sp. Root495 TaxID=1736550 RepID=UPI0009E8FFAB|nr:restriction endonuclease subunit S [Aeromicrobium sp. Root495]